ncbi:MAG: carboxypeptidase-like regulatory domain-containing protein [Saprospiraceae bacterium]|nr:carboxypeptidase-like regulatory domain-containing protein [Saprospiraceae bacterium]
MILRKPAAERVSFFRIFLTALFLCLGIVMSQAQGILGSVEEEFSRYPLATAVITISLGDSIVYQGTTDSLGRYVWKSEKAGRFSIDIISDGYLPYELSNIILDGYSTRKVEHLLQKTSFDLEAVTVVASRHSSTPYIRTITPDDMLQVAGNFEDPVRVAHSQPGIVLLNDQANQLSARGKSPVFNSWLLEGLDIVNPNHTNNAGTYSDLPTQYGGGVNMFSAQTLGSTDVYIGLNPISINNISSAAIDMHLHETAKPEWRAKAGLLGFELGGGIGLGTNRILDFNFRYSFTGLLTAMGVDFGGEQINYYDGVLSFRQYGDLHALKVFAWAGESKNTFDKAEDAADIDEYKDYFDIDYGNNIVGAGATYAYAFSAKLHLKTGTAYSTNQTSYSKQGQFESHIESVDDDARISIFSAFAELAFRHSDRVQTIAGVNFKNRTYGNESFGPYPYLPFAEESLVRPYINSGVWLVKGLKLDLGADLSYSAMHDTWDPGYRATLKWHYAPEQAVFAGTRSGPGEVRIRPVGPEIAAYHLRNQVYEVGWNFVTGKHAFTLDAYIHSMSKLLRLDLTEGFFHLADYPFTYSDAEPVAVSYEAKGMYRGIEGQWNYNHSGWRFNINQSFFQSERDVSDGSLQPGRYNGQYATHLSIAKELIREKNGKARIWNFSMRGMLHGGLWEEQIDVDASAQYYTTLYKPSGYFDQRLEDYKRVDLSIVRTIAFAKIRWRYSLDIQNVLNFSNTAWRYYDPYLKAIAGQSQLGIIPVLSVQASW